MKVGTWVNCSEGPFLGDSPSRFRTKSLKLFNPQSQPKMPSDSGRRGRAQKNGGLRLRLQPALRAPRGGQGPTVRAYNGPLPVGARGVEFTTAVAPEPGAGVPLPGGPVRWYGGITPGVVVNPEGYAVIPAIITRNTQVSP
jgi:hypothetical protein